MLQRRHITRTARIALPLLAIPLIVLLVRAYDARSLPDMELWHTVDLTTEFRASRPHKDMSFDDYLQLEEQLFKELNEKICLVHKSSSDAPFIRYTPGSLSDPGRFERNWNRSFELVPDEIKGGVLLLHGLTDSPYSLRSIAQIFHDHGYYVLCPRLPGHGTIPAALTNTRWQDWLPVVEMAATHVRDRTGQDAPFYLGGYSNGGTLATKFTLDALQDGHHPPPDKLFLFSPAIGVTRFAVFANWHKLLSFLPYFEKFKWQSIEPEFDPFKYNSFPKNAGDQTHQLSKTVQHQLKRAAKNGTISQLPPILTFQSVVDSTVNSQDVIDKLYSKITTLESELVLFDVNRATQLEGFIRKGQGTMMSDRSTATTTPYTLTIVTNADTKTLEVAAITTPSRPGEQSVQLLNLSWPPQVYSLSHVAIPFPPDDPVYGNGLNYFQLEVLLIGSLQPRGEQHLLTIPAHRLLRLRYNPFFSYIRHRIKQTLADTGANGAPSH